MPQLDEATSAYPGQVAKVPIGRVAYTVDMWRGKRKPTAVTCKLLGSMKNDDTKDTLYVSSGLSAGVADTAKLKVSEFAFRVAGTVYQKAAAEFTFLAGHAITASKYAVLSVFINSAGSIFTRIGTPSTHQGNVYGKDTAEEAFVDADYELLAYAHGSYSGQDFTFSTKSIRLGWILIQNNGTLWQANIDDLVTGSDVTAITFIDAPLDFDVIDTFTWTSAQIDQGRYIEPVIYGGWYKYVLLYLSSVSGNNAKISGDVYSYNLPS